MEKNGGKMKKRLVSVVVILVSFLSGVATHWFFAPGEAEYAQHYLLAAVIHGIGDEITVVYNQKGDYSFVYGSPVKTDPVSADAFTTLVGDGVWPELDEIIKHCGRTRIVFQQIGPPSARGYFVLETACGWYKMYYDHGWKIERMNPPF